MIEPSEYAELPLLPQHAQLLADSDISLEVATSRGYRSIEKKVQLDELGFNEKQRRVPGLLLPVHGVTGDIVLHQYRPDTPRADRDGKYVKYETPRGARMALDIPPAARPHLGNPNRALFITEGVRKADSAASHDLCCTALLGVWNFRGSNTDGGKVMLPDWEYIALNGREVYIVFDSDVMLKSGVHQALTRLKAFLGTRG